MKTNRTSVLFAYLIVIMIVGLVSCRKSSSTQDSTPYVLSLAYDSVVVNDRIALIEGQPEPFCELKINFVYPSCLDGDSVHLQKVQSHYIESMFGKEFSSMSPQDAVSAYAKSYKKQYQETAADYAHARAQGLQMESWGNTYQVMQVDTLKSLPGVLSYSTYIESFSGGAHGSHATMYYNVDLSTGNLIKESDLFVDGAADDLKHLLIRQLLEDNQVKSSEALIQKGFFDVSELKSNKNFLLNREGVLYGFNEYEIGPYYMGLIKIQLSGEKLSNLLRPDQKFIVQE